MTPTRPDSKPPEHSPGSQSAEDEPYQHGPLTGKDKPGTAEHPARNIETERTSVGELADIPDRPVTEKPEKPAPA